MDKLSEILRDNDSRIAVVGATNNTSKYGSVIYRDLKRKGYRVYAVNPKRSEVHGDPVYDSLSDLPEPPDIVNLVVPGSVGLEVARQARGLGYMNIWVQPGADSPELIAYLQEQEFDYLADACIMVRSRLVSN